MERARTMLGPVHAHGLFAASLATIAPLYLLASPPVRKLVFLGVILGAVVAIIVGVRVHRIVDRLPWRLFAGGLSCLAVPQALALVATIDPATQQLVHQRFRALGYVGMLLSAAVLVLRHAPHDPGGLIDSALIGLCGVGPLWELVLRPPLLAAGISVASQLLRLIELALLMLLLGALLRTAVTTARGRATLYYFFAAFAATLAGLVTTVLVGDPATGTYPDAVKLLWIFGYLCAAAGALHPAARNISTPEGIRHDDLTDRRLAAMGAALCVTPTIAGVSQFVSSSPDALVLAGGTLAAIPLVLLRFRQLAQQRRSAERSLQYLAAHDALTGLPNRRALVHELDDALRQANGVAVLFCDLDKFKPINDSLGHAVGDTVLKLVAERLSTCVRAGDVLGRFGGDEFVVLCRDTSPADAERIAERIQGAFAEPFLVAGVRCRLGASIGIARSGPADGDTADSVIARADTAMYELKRARADSPDDQPRKGSHVPYGKPAAGAVR